MALLPSKEEKEEHWGEVDTTVEELLKLRAMHTAASQPAPLSPVAGKTMEMQLTHSRKVQRIAHRKHMHLLANHQPANQ